MHDFLVSAVAFIVLIGVMVLIHELGHFVVAKFFGVRVERFSIGFPPRLFGIQIGETDYCISATPLGGYVKMTGENLPGENMSLEGADAETLAAQQVDPGALTSKPRWQRILIALAGPAANFVLAFFLMWIYFHWINEVPRADIKTTTIDWVVPGSAAAQAGLQPGDVISSFANVSNPSWDQVDQQAAVNMNQAVPMTVNRAGQSLPIALHLPAMQPQGFDISDVGMIPQFVQAPIGVQQVMPSSAAARAGLQDGDLIQSVDGHAFHSVEALLAYMQAGKGKPLSLVVLRNGVTLAPLTATPTQMDKSETYQWKLGFYQVPIPIHSVSLPIGVAASKSASFCADNSFLIIEVLGRIFTRQVPVTQLSGPVGIARMAGEAAQTQGWMPKFGLASAISLNLGILNLFPFPILDGGLIALLLIESVIRRDVSMIVKERLFQAAFVVLMLFVVFTIFNDVTQLPIFAHIKP